MQGPVRPELQEPYHDPESSSIPASLSFPKFWPSVASWIALRPWPGSERAHVIMWPTITCSSYGPEMSGFVQGQGYVPNPELFRILGAWGFMLADWVRHMFEQQESNLLHLWPLLSPLGSLVIRVGPDRASVWGFHVATWVFGFPSVNPSWSGSIIPKSGEFVGRRTDPLTPSAGCRGAPCWRSFLDDPLILGLGSVSPSVPLGISEFPCSSGWAFASLPPLMRQVAPSLSQARPSSTDPSPWLLLGGYSQDHCYPTPCSLHGWYVHASNSGPADGSTLPSPAGREFPKAQNWIGQYLSNVALCWDRPRGGVAEWSPSLVPEREQMGVVRGQRGLLTTLPF